MKSSSIGSDQRKDQPDTRGKEVRAGKAGMQVPTTSTYLGRYY